MTFDEYMKKHIREYMTNRFYLEGEKKDYYFGKRPLNDHLTVFFNSKDCWHVVQQAVSDSHLQMLRENNMRWKAENKVDLSQSAFHIPVISAEFVDVDEDSDDEYTFYINYMQTGVLEEAIQKEPERWELYQKLKNQ